MLAEDEGRIKRMMKWLEGYLDRKSLRLNVEKKGVEYKKKEEM